MVHSRLVRPTVDNRELQFVSRTGSLLHGSLAPPNCAVLQTRTALFLSKERDSHRVERTVFDVLETPLRNEGASEGIQLFQVQLLWRKNGFVLADRGRSRDLECNRAIRTKGSSQAGL